jgi:putative transposase
MNEYYRRRLPHFHPLRATYFITFRLVHSLPNHIIEQLKTEHEEYEKQLRERSDVKNGSALRVAVEEYHHAYFTAFDGFLDAQKEGNRWLADDSLAGVVRDALHHRDGMVYDLVCYTIMPNHVHMVCTLEGSSQSGWRTGRGSRSTPVTSMLHSLKRYTARECNKVLKREGVFWQQESYDRVIRNLQELDRTINYVLNNPVTAGLVNDRKDWKYSYCKYQ